MRIIFPITYLLVYGLFFPMLTFAADKDPTLDSRPLEPSYKSSPEWSREITGIESLLPGGFVAASRVFAHQFGISGYLHQGGFVELPNGDIICAYPATKVKGDYGGDLGAKRGYMWRSRDGGNTWEEVQTPFEDNALGASGGGGMLLRLPNRLLMFGGPWIKEGLPEGVRPWIRVMTSLDEGKTWGSFKSNGTDWKATNAIGISSSPKDIYPPTGDSGFNRWGPVGSFRPQKLRSGRILIGLGATWMDEPPATTHNTIWWYRSDDEGATWEYHGAIKRPPTGETFCEPTLVELPDGRLLCFIRSYNTILSEGRMLSEYGHLTYKGARYYYLAVSEDGGETWSEAWPCYLGEEMSQGAMADMCLLGDYIYLVGNFGQFNPPDVPGLITMDYLSSHHPALFKSMYYMQRTPLLLLRIPVSQVMEHRRGAFILEPDAIRPLAVSVHNDIALGSTFNTPQIQAISDGTLGIICDTHTRGFNESDILFFRVTPEWITEGPPLALWRGPIPLVTPEGEIRILHTQTTVRPTKFPIGQLPLEITFIMRPHYLERREPVLHPLFTVWNSATLSVPKTAYPNAIFASLEVQTTTFKDGPCHFVVNTGAGRKPLDLPLWMHKEYQVKIVIIDICISNAIYSGYPEDGGYPDATFWICQAT